MNGKFGSPITCANFRTFVLNGMVQMARPGLPSCSKEMLSCKLHAEQLPQMDGMVQMARPGLPSCSKEMLSCKLHAEQLPQSPAAVIRKSERSAIECSMSGSAVRLESSLFSTGNATQWCRSTNHRAVSTRSISAFAF